METAPDFGELVVALRSLNAGIGPADLHGSLCGYLCAGGQNIRQFLEAVSLQALLDSGADGLRLFTLPRVMFTM